MYNELKDNQIFVFGSNRNGAHAGGAARQAYESFGAEWGVGDGRSGRCYAFPTLNEHMEKVSTDELEKSRDRLFAYAEAHTELEFLLTKVGCGIAGFKEEEIAPLFKDAPKNIIKPNGW